jgi:hypothetical protein
MLTAIKGTFRNGRVELDEDPGIVGEAPVVVTFLNADESSAQNPRSRMITFGMLREPGRRMSDDKDFQAAEHLDKPWDDEVGQ